MMNFKDILNEPNPLGATKKEKVNSPRYFRSCLIIHLMSVIELIRYNRLN